MQPNMLEPPKRDKAFSGRPQGPAPPATMWLKLEKVELLGDNAGSDIFVVAKCGPHWARTKVIKEGQRWDWEVSGTNGHIVRSSRCVQADVVMGDSTWPVALIKLSSSRMCCNS